MGKLLKLLANEENPNSLINAYEDLMDARPINMPTTRAAARGDPRTIYAKTSAYHNSFLPRTVRELNPTIITQYQLISKCSLLLQSSIALLYNIVAKDLN